MALTYIDAVNGVLSSLGEDSVSSVTAGGVASSRVKGYVNDAWAYLLAGDSWNWAQTTGSFASLSTTQPDIMVASGFMVINSVLIKQDDGSSRTRLPMTDDNVLMIGPTQITEEVTWTTGEVLATAGIVRAYQTRVYTSTTAGTTGSTPPVHTSGTVTDGGVSWTYTRLFALQGQPLGFSVLSANQLRLRPYPGTLGLQRYLASGDMAATRLASDADTFPNLPSEFQSPLIDIASSFGALKHLDDSDAARNLMRLSQDKLNALRARNRYIAKPRRASMAHGGLTL